jgi:hypothetical protein
MPRPRQRARLESGLKLDLNRLRRQGGVRPGAKVGPYVIRWTNTYTGEEIASGLITANMEGQFQGWFRIQLGNLDQWIDLIPQPRHFGGHQWYFECPSLHSIVDATWCTPLL